MLGKLRKLNQISIIQYLHYNYFCKSVIRKNGHKLIPYKNSIIKLSPDSKLILDGDFHLNCNKIGNSKAEAYLVLNGTGQLHVKGNLRIRFGSTIQVNNAAKAVFNRFSCNAHINIQCNNEITIGEDCMMGRNVVIYDSAYHPTGTSIKNMSISQAPIRIGNHVWLGANSVIMQGTEIGDGSIIGTNAYVSGKIEPGTFIAPAFDQPTSVGMMWARDMNSLDVAAKYRIEDQPVRCNGNNVEEIEARILKVLSSKITSINFSTDRLLVDERIIDSLGLISVVKLLENEFSIKIPFTSVNARNFNSVHSMAVLIDSFKTEIQKERKETDSIILEPLNIDIKETEKSVVQRIMENALINPKDDAIIANDKETTFQEIADMILSISKWLEARGVEEGDCVTVQAIHEDTCIATYYAIHLLGAKLVPVEKSAAQKRIKEIADVTKCRLIISLNKEEEENWYDYDEIRLISHTHIFSSSTQIQYPDLDLPCEMIFTTGTTGKSKGVLMTHRHISWYSYSVAKCVEMKKKNRFLLTTPLNHAGGLRRTHLSLANGCCMVYMDGLSNLSKYFDYIEKYKVTSLYLPPVAIRILMTRTGKELSKFRNQIDFVYSSSSPLPVGDCEELRKLLPNTRLYNAYEASETPGVSAYNYNTENVLKNCMGKANEGVELAVLSEDGSIVTTPNIQGQICVKSKMNMQEYYMEYELTKSVWKEGWFVSNDLGYMDDEGNVYYNGRKGDVINIGGYKIAPTDVEETALLSGMIDECICIEAYDEFQIPYLKLLVVVPDKRNFDSTKLGEFLTDKLEAYKVPRKIEIIDKVEKTFNGKIDRKAYR